MFMRRIAVALAAPLLMTACIFTPGKFTSGMTVNADGRFNFAYKGEIVFISAYDMDKAAGAGGMDLDNKCYGPVPSGDTSMMDDTDMQAMEDAADALDDAANAVDAAADEVDMEMSDDTSTTTTDADWSEERPCTDEEKAEKAKNRAASEERKKQERQQAAQFFGFDPEDEASMRDFAAQMMKQAGWKSVVYKGKGIFDVDYAVAGTLDRDFVFPVFPKSQMIFPLLIARRRADGTVQVSAPAFAGLPGSGMGPAGMLAGMASMGDPAGGANTPKIPMPDGTFTLTTDAEILTNNTDEGPAMAGAMRTLKWRVDAKSTKAPETLLRLRR